MRALVRERGAARKKSFFTNVRKGGRLSNREHAECSEEAVRFDAERKRRGEGVEEIHIGGLTLGGRQKKKHGWDNFSASWGKNSGDSLFDPQPNHQKRKTGKYRPGKDRKSCQKKGAAFQVLQEGGDHQQHGKLEENGGGPRLKR